MKKLLLTLLFGLFLTSLSVQATSPKSLVVFGDSFSDIGNMYYLFGEPSDDPWFTQGRIGDGPSWSDYLADYYKHIPYMEPSWSGGSNYAQGGADSTFGDGVWGLGSTGQQVAQFLTDTGRITGAGNVLFAIWVGANDYLGSGETDVSVPTDNIAEQVSMLVEAGAVHLLVVNMPPLGLTPDGLAGGGFNGLNIPSDELNLLSIEHNEALLTAIAEVKCSYPSAKFYHVDVHQLMLDVLNDPDAYGFLNVTDPAFDFGIYDIAGDPDTSLWWDGLHFTSRFHSLLAERMAKVVKHHRGGIKCDAY